MVLLVDLLDASGTLMSRVRDMVGQNPIVLVGTKMDLLPDGCRPKDVAGWLTDAATRRRMNVVSTHLVSSHTGKNLDCFWIKLRFGVRRMNVVSTHVVSSHTGKG